MRLLEQVKEEVNYLSISSFAKRILKYIFHVESYVCCNYL